MTIFIESYSNLTRANFFPLLFKKSSTVDYLESLHHRKKAKAFQMRLRIFIRRLVRPSVRLVLFSNEGYGRFWSHQMKSKSMTDNEVVASDVPPWYLFFGNQLSIVGKKGTSAMVLHLSSSFTSDSMILCSWHSLTSLKHRLVNAFQPLAEPTDRRTGQTTDERTYLFIQMWKCVKPYQEDRVIASNVKSDFGLIVHISSRNLRRSRKFCWKIRIL